MDEDVFKAQLDVENLATFNLESESIEGLIVPKLCQIVWISIIVCKSRIVNPESIEGLIAPKLCQIV
jgi:hypothetical protein